MKSVFHNCFLMVKYENKLRLIIDQKTDTVYFERNYCHWKEPGQVIATDVPQALSSHLHIYLNLQLKHSLIR